MRERAARIQRRLAELGDLTPGAIDRPGWSAAETAAHELAAGWMREAGLDVATDPAGNLHGVLAGTAGTGEVWCGSHLDTVPGGGRYDGALGVLMALEAVAALGPQPRGLTVVAWRDEEGTRFGLGCNGARALTGTLTERQLALTDADGITLAQAMDDVGATTRDGWAVPPPVAYLEPHMEGATLLDRAGLSTAVVTGSVARVRLDVTVHGRLGHASSPVDRRQDAGYVAAQLVVAVRQLAGERGCVGTVGAIEVFPGARNVIPERAELFLDLRAPGDALLDELLAAFRATADAAAAAERCTVALTTRQHEPAVVFPAAPLEALRAQVDPRAPELVSWGGHDALIVAQAGVPVGMLYLASGNDGAAHSAAEHTGTAVIANGLHVLCGALRTLAA